MGPRREYTWHLIFRSSHNERLCLLSDVWEISITVHVVHTQHAFKYITRIMKWRDCVQTITLVNKRHGAMQSKLSSFQTYCGRWDMVWRHQHDCGCLKTSRPDFLLWIKSARRSINLKWPTVVCYATNSNTFISLHSLCRERATLDFT